jgi:hypothetical protein
MEWIQFIPVEYPASLEAVRQLPSVIKNSFFFDLKVLFAFFLAFIIIINNCRTASLLRGGKTSPVAVNDNLIYQFHFWLLTSAQTKLSRVIVFFNRI